MAGQNLSKTIGKCACCQRQTRLEFHHLIPRKNHKKPWFQRHFSIEEMRGRGIYICKDCHRAIHRFFNEMELGKHYNTLDKLLENDDMQRFIEWVKKRRITI